MDRAALGLLKVVVLQYDAVTCNGSQNIAAYNKKYALGSGNLSAWKKSYSSLTNPYRGWQYNATDNLVTINRMYSTLIRSILVT